MTKNLLSTLITISVIIVLWITNPKEYQIKEHFKTELADEGHEIGRITGAIQELFSGPSSWLMSLTVERKNYFIFSVYTVEGLDKKYRYIGVLSNFFELPS